MAATMTEHVTVCARCGRDTHTRAVLKRAGHDRWVEWWCLPCWADKTLEQLRSHPGVGMASASVSHRLCEDLAVNDPLYAPLLLGGAIHTAANAACGTLDTLGDDPVTRSAAQDAACQLIAAGVCALAWLDAHQQSGRAAEWPHEDRQEEAA